MARTPPPSCQPVGIVEIAERLDVKRNTVDVWRMTADECGFPEARWTVGGRPCWNWSDIEEWAMRRRRGPYARAAAEPDA